MSLFSLKKTTERIGAVVDIGSASVLVSLVSSIPGSEFPHVIWSHREYTPLRNIDAIEQTGKAVMTSLMNAMIKLDSEGRKALHAYNGTSRIPTIQCSIAAPWSYTITKSIEYKKDDPFTLSDTLVSELVAAANSAIADELEKNIAATELDLQMISHATVHMRANGYSISAPLGQQANILSLSHTSALTQKYLLDNLTSLQQKLFPETVVQKTSYALVFFSAAKTLYKNLTDACLVHITYESTEIGIVRDGMLTYTSHIPYGSFSLAREISAITNASLYESFQYLHTENPFEFVKNLSAAKKDELETLFQNYTTRVSDLLSETGDELSIPKKIILHSDLRSENLFKDTLDKAARKILKTDPYIKTITPELFEAMTHGEFAHQPKELTDTAMLVSAQFFHTSDRTRFFEYT